MGNVNKTYRRIVIKIGSNVLTNKEGLPDLAVLKSLVTQIVKTKQQGIQVIIVSSGAVAAGKSIYKTRGKIGTIAQKQLFAALGQVKLMEHYNNFFKAENFLCAQVLVTKEDFRDRKHYLNMKNCLNVLLENQIIPIVNENDVISVTELMFTDNDELAGMIATMLKVYALLVMSNVYGVYDGDPSLEISNIIKTFSG
ncbi:MAG: glutamate 5-kinase, partial [Bacteroidota bacterium]